MEHEDGKNLCHWVITVGIIALFVLPIWPRSFAQTSVTLTIATQYADGATLPGMWTTLRGSSGQLLASGFSPINFSVVAGQTYTVTVGNYQEVVFHHWDNGSTAAARQVSVSSSTVFTAYYVSPSHPLPSTSQPFTPITHMADTTISYGVLVNSPSQIFAGEWVKSASQLVGDQIDSITLRLQRSGSPPGTYTVGVYDSNLVLKKSFGVVSASTLPATMTDMEFTIPDLYTIQTGDRIGLFYNGASGGVLLMMDKVTSDTMFDGQNTQRVRYGTSWITYDINEDLYMILKQTKASSGGTPTGNQPPTANTQSVSVDENSSTTITLSGSDPEGQPITFHVVNQPQHGVLSLVDPATRRVTYTPYNYYDGSDNFTFVTNDGGSDSSPATVSINVANIATDTTSDIVVITEFENSHSLTGIFVELRQNSVAINSGFSHVDFQVNNGQTYTVTMTNFENFVFHHWQDNGSTNPTRSININEDSAVVAVYQLL